MTVKMIINKDIAEAIESYLNDGHLMERSIDETKACLVSQHWKQDWNKFEVGQYKALNDITTFDLMNCLVNGYEIN